MRSHIGIDRTSDDSFLCDQKRAETQPCPVPSIHILLCLRARLDISSFALPHQGIASGPLISRSTISILPSLSSSSPLYPCPCPHLFPILLTTNLPTPHTLPAMIVPAMPVGAKTKPAPDTTVPNAPALEHVSVKALVRTPVPPERWSVRSIHLPSQTTR